MIDSTATLKPPTIMVVEDDVNMLPGICDILEMVGYDILRASNGLDALDVLRSAPQMPSLIVSDIGMPKLDGYGLLDAVRQERDWTEIPFIFLTALAEKEHFRKGMIAGVDDYLTKPFHPEELLQAIRAKLKRREELASARALQIKEIKRSILTILNHEFRTPLTPVVAYADMVSSDPTTLSGEELTLFLKGINVGAKRLRQLVEDFILLIELETGEAETAYGYRRAVVRNLEGILYNVISASSEAAAAHGLRVGLDSPLPINLPPFIADSEYLQSALMRLVDNAIKFSDKPGGEIQLSVSAEGNNVLISVTDQGRGIPEAQFELIFDSFYQINRQHFEDQGTGSGLAIVKAIMQLHNGDILLSSKPGVGSVFTLVLPTV